MTSQQQLDQHGPIASVRFRRYSKPIPTEFEGRFAAAGLTVTDRDDAVEIYRDGRKVAAVWGPAVEGHWFAYAEGQHNGEAIRVGGRDEGLQLVLGDDVQGVIA